MQLPTETAHDDPASKVIDVDLPVRGPGAAIIPVMFAGLLGVITAVALRETVFAQSPRGGAWVLTTLLPMALYLQLALAYFVRRTKREVARIVRAHCTEHPVNVVTEVFYFPTLHDVRAVGFLTRELAEAGVTGWVMWSAGARPPLSVKPLAKQFEPIPVDESHPGFVGLEQSSDHVGRGDTRESAEEIRPGRTRLLSGSLTRRVSLFGGALLFVVIVTCYTVWWAVDIVRGRVNPVLATLSVVMICVLLGIGGVGAWRVNKQWLLVPGGVIYRRARLFQRKWEVHLLPRRESVLAVFIGPGRRWHAAVGGRGVSALTQLTQREAILLLRAWLSSLPPPTLAQLTDLH